MSAFSFAAASALPFAPMFYVFFLLKFLRFESELSFLLLFSYYFILFSFFNNFIKQLTAAQKTLRIDVIWFSLYWCANRDLTEKYIHFVSYSQKKLFSFSFSMWTKIKGTEYHYHFDVHWYLCLRMWFIVKFRWYNKIIHTQMKVAFDQHNAVGWLHATSLPITVA